ncbi:cysteine dioxygenase [Bacillus rubiinfantis]|uniref:cysteine dioxygenase n=1 Tax=Bacillus rubiinfantis TaxID=1499680 RepID=UPI0005AA898D|nr:cysteine dioxygenase family protein [Bacillus rubiinfantis]
MELIQDIQTMFHHLPSYTKENIDLAVKKLQLTFDQLRPYITAPLELEYGRNVIFNNGKIEVIVVHLPSMAKTLVHDHGTSSGCIKIVKGKLLNLVYHQQETELIPLINESKLFAAGDIFHVTGDTIHMMFNPTLSPVVTFHVYSPPLSSGNLYQPNSETLAAKEENGYGNN